MLLLNKSFRAGLQKKKQLKFQEQKADAETHLRVEHWRQERNIIEVGRRLLSLQEGEEAGK